MHRQRVHGVTGALLAPSRPVMQVMLLLMTFTGFLVSGEAGEEGKFLKECAAWCPKRELLGAAPFTARDGPCVPTLLACDMLSQCGTLLPHPPAAIPVYFNWIKWASYLNYTYAAREPHGLMVVRQQAQRCLPACVLACPPACPPACPTVSAFLPCQPSPGKEH